MKSCKLFGVNYGRNRSVRAFKGNLLVGRAWRPVLPAHLQSNVLQNLLKNLLTSRAETRFVLVEQNFRGKHRILRNENYSALGRETET